MELLDLPPEIILYISDFLKYHDKYHFSKTTKEIYLLIWKPLDTRKIYQKLFYLQYMNIYGAFFSDLPKCWIDFPFSIYIKDEFYDNFTIEFYYHQGKLNVKFFKLGYYQSKNLTVKHIEYFNKVKEIGYVQEYIGVGRNNIVVLFENVDSQIEISKWIGTVEEFGWDCILDKIHQEVCLLIHHLKASFTEILVHESYGEFADFYDRIYIKLKEITSKNYQKHIKEEIIKEYLLNTIDDRKYSFMHYENLSKTILSKYSQIFCELRKEIGASNIKKLAKYFEKSFIDLLK